MKTRRKSRFFPYAMLFPTIVVFAVIMIYPILYSLYLSFTDFTGGTYEFVGLRTYIELFNDPVLWSFSAARRTSGFIPHGRRELPSSSPSPGDGWATT